MINGRMPACLTALVLAVLLSLVLWLQPYSADWPGAGYAPGARRYLRAALREDSAALVRLSASGRPVTWALTAARTRRAVLETWAHDAEAWVGERHGDTAQVFVFNASRDVCPEHPITLIFVGSGADARVVRASSPCLEAP